MTFHSSHRRGYSWGVASIALLALISGCAKPSPVGPGSSSSSTIPYPDTSPRPGLPAYRPDDLVLRVELVHGFMREYFLTQLPILSVYGDGRAINEGPQIATHPGPALPNIVVFTISAAGVHALANRALDHNVGRKIDYGHPNIYDAPGTRITVLTDSGPLVTDVYALGYDEPNDGLTDAQRLARRNLQALVDDLKDLPKTLGSELGDQQPYQPKAIAAVSHESTASNPPDQTERAWPGPPLPGEPIGMATGFSCLSVTGADATAVVSAAATANELTPWTSAGQRWLVGFRPLLPDESSCADLS
jgi:hypothetical protein